MTDNDTDRNELRRRLTGREAEFSKSLPRLDAAISTAAKALGEAHEAEVRARRAHVLTQTTRRDYIRNRSEADATDLAELRATGATAVVAALADARAQVADARHTEAAPRLVAWEVCVGDLEALLLVDDADMPARISEVLAHVPARISWRAAIAELLAARPRFIQGDDSLSPAGRAIEEVMSELRTIDPLAKDARKKIDEAMRGVRRYLQVVA